MRPAILALFLAPALASACAARPERVAEAPREHSAAIEWHDWSEDAFALAQREGRMIVVDVGIEGCTACRWMDERTYSDPEVVALVAKHFVAISVDANASACSSPITDPAEVARAAAPFAEL